LQTTFILQMNFTKTQYATYNKLIGFYTVIAANNLAGLILLRMPIIRCLMAFGVFQVAAVAAFSLLSLHPGEVVYLAAVVIFESLTTGFGTTALTVYMATLTNKRFTATQYALFSSLMSIPRVILVAPTGFVAEYLGWTKYFLFCALMAVPGLLLIRKLP